MTARGRLGSSTYALMYWMGSSKAPSDQLGLSWPSYSNLLSISCTLDRWSLTSTNGFFDPSVMVLARNTGMRPENGIRIVCQAPGTVSNEHVYPTPSNESSVRAMNLYRCPSPLTRSSNPS